ncbi:M15 family metallopeptidase [Viscerimonas tarda]
MKLRDVKKKNKPEKKGRSSLYLAAFLPVIVFSLFYCSGKPSAKDADDNISVQDSLASENSADKIPKSSLELQLDSLGLRDIKACYPSIAIDLKYASADNFAGRILYKNLNRAYLHPYAMAKLAKAQSLLKSQHPEYSLLVYDAARPLAIQREMFEMVKNTPQQPYVANPERTGLHNYGMAVDITICDTTNLSLDMGTKFDYFGAKAGIDNEDSYVLNGVLTHQQVANRRLLRTVMTEAGFNTIRGEWWHFNACSLQEAKRMAEVL